MSNYLVRWGIRAMQILLLLSVFWGMVIHGAFGALSATVLFGLLGSAFCLWVSLRLFARSQDDLSLQRCRHSEPVPALSVPSPWIWGPIVLLGFFVIIQTIPLPTWLVGSFSPQRVRLAHRLSEALPELWTNSLTISVNPDFSRRDLPFFLFPVIAFILGNFMASSRKRVRKIIRFLVCLVMAEALYGLAEQLSGHRYMLWIPIPGGGENALGTFVNRNHFAAVLSLFLPITVGWIYFRASDTVNDLDHDEIRPPTSWDFLASSRGLWLLGPAVLVLGIIQSHSRGGFSTMLFGLALMLGRGFRSHLARTLAATGVLLAIVILVYTINSDYRLVLNRFENLTETESQNGRITIWRNSLGIVSDYPMVGIGLGNFADVYRQYETESTGYSPYQAHNEWLEGVLTFGILGFCPLLLALVVCFVKSYRIACEGERDKPWLLGVWCGLLGLALHSFVEFTFHSPGIIIPASFLMGLLLGFERLNASRQHEWRRLADHEQRKDGEAYEVRVLNGAYSIRQEKEG